MSENGQSQGPNPATLIDGEKLEGIPAEQVAAATSALQQQLNALSPPHRIALGTLIRGMQVSAPGIPPVVILQSVAWHVGNILGQSLAGDLVAVMKIRKGLKDAFEDGVKKSKINTEAAPASLPHMRG